MADIITKGAIVDLSATLTGVNGTLTGTSAFDFQQMLQHIDWVAVDLEGQYGIFTGYKKSSNLLVQSNENSGLTDTDMYPFATILAYRSHAILGIGQVTYERVRRLATDYINRLSPVKCGDRATNEQLPLGAGNTREIGFQPYFYERIKSIDVQSDGNLDLGNIKFDP